MKKKKFSIFNRKSKDKSLTSKDKYLTGDITFNKKLNFFDRIFYFSIIFFFFFFFFFFFI